MWDLYPAWREDGVRPCRHNDKETIVRALNEANVAAAQVALVCIEEELEAWLLADGRALSEFLSKPHRQVTIADKKNADRVPRPKTVLTQCMQQNGGGMYSDRVHARRIIEKLPDLKRLRKCKSFARFETKILAQDSYKIA